MNPVGDLVPIRPTPPPFDAGDAFLRWLASPLRVMAAVIRLLTATGIAVPAYYAWTLRAPGLLLFEVVVGIPMWAWMAMAIHGPDKMMNENPPLRLWLWRNVTAWWALPLGARP